MFDLWILAAIFAAFMQNLRSALQKHLKSRLSTGGATYVRFLYAAPLALVWLLGVQQVTGYDYPAINSRFLLFCLLGGIMQILFTFLLVYMFSLRNFAVGTAYSKTEVIQVAFLGLILLGDTVSLTSLAAICTGMVGILALSGAHTGVTWKALGASLFKKSTMVGLLCGTVLGASVVFFRGASLALGDGPVIMRVAFTLCFALTMQTVIMGIYLLTRERGQMIAVLRHWRVASLVGIAAFLGSIGWFTAFTLQNAAFVRAVGQIELVFTFIASVIFFKEKTNAMELLGIGLIVAAIIVLVLAG